MKPITESTLIFWLCCYVLGILSFLSDIYWITLIFASIVFIAGCCIPKIPEGFRNYFVFAPLFFVLGSFSIEGVFPKTNNQLVAGESHYLGKIEQQLNNGKVWTTNIVRLEAGLNSNRKWKQTNERIVLLTENNETILRQNDVILFRTDLKEIALANNPGEFNAKTYWLSKRVRYQGFAGSEQFKLIEHVPLGWFDQTLEDVRNYSTKILDKWVGKKDAPLIKAILLGDKSDLDMETKRIFTNTGAMHMLAVSGMHIGLIVVLLGGIFKLLFLHRGRVVSLWLMVILLWFYAFLTGFSASVTRAVVMFTVLILAGFMKRGYQPINSLSIAGFFILLWDPMTIFDIGFQLSFLAMVGIFTVYPMIENLLTFKYEWLNTTWKGTAIGLASQVFTVPISVFYFNQFPNYFILTNFGVMLFSGVMLGLAIGLLAFGKIYLLSLPAGWILAICSSLLVGFIAFVELIPGALAVGFTPGWSWVIAMYLFVCIALIWAEKKQFLAIFLCLIPLVIWLQFDRFNNLEKREWVIFNSNFPTLLINNAGEQICLYGGNEKGIKQAQRLVTDYQKIHPGTIEFVPISKDKYSIFTASDTLVLEPKYGWINIRMNNDQYALVTSEKTPEKEIDSKAKIIVMKKNSVFKSVYNLSKGALRFPLQDR